MNYNHPAVNEFAALIECADKNMSQPERERFIVAAYEKTIDAEYVRQGLNPNTVEKYLGSVWGVDDALLPTALGDLLDMAPPQDSGYESSYWDGLADMVDGYESRQNPEPVLSTRVRRQAEAEAA